MPFGGYGWYQMQTQRHRKKSPNFCIEWGMAVLPPTHPITPRPLLEVHSPTGLEACGRRQDFILIAD